MKTFISGLFVLCSLALASVAAAGVEGAYVIDKEALIKGIQSQPEFAELPEEEQKTMLGMFDDMELKMTLDGGNFSAEASMMGEISLAKGTYEIDGDKVVMTTVEEDGEVKATPEVTLMTIVGETLTIQEEGMPFPMVLSKAE